MKEKALDEQRQILQTIQEPESEGETPAGIMSDVPLEDNETSSHNSSNRSNNIHQQETFAIEVPSSTESSGRNSDASFNPYL